MRVIAPEEQELCSQCHEFMQWGAELADPGEYPPEAICETCLRAWIDIIEMDRQAFKKEEPPHETEGVEVSEA